MRIRPLTTLALIALTAAGLSGQSSASERPHLDIRALPRVAMSPTDVAFTAKLIGGEELEDFHCPEVEWNWNDGARSVREGDCDPYEQGDEVVRVFSARHRFRQAGLYTVTVSLRRASRVVAAATVTIDVKPGFPGKY
jgi:hypothetical protein